MSIFEIFDSRDRQRRRTHVRNLIALAVAQGPISGSDRDLLFKIGIRGGLGPMELHRLLRGGYPLSFSSPSSPRDCMEQLYDVVLVMMPNGHLGAQEASLCRATARRLGFPKPAVEPVIRYMVAAIAEGRPSEPVIRRLVEEWQV